MDFILYDRFGNRFVRTQLDVPHIQIEESCNGRSQVAGEHNLHQHGDNSFSLFYYPAYGGASCRARVVTLAVLTGTGETIFSKTVSVKKEWEEEGRAYLKLTPRPEPAEAPEEELELPLLSGDPAEIARLGSKKQRVAEMLGLRDRDAPGPRGEKTWDLDDVKVTLSPLDRSDGVRDENFCFDEDKAFEVDLESWHEYWAMVMRQCPLVKSNIVVEAEIKKRQMIWSMEGKLHQLPEWTRNLLLDEMGEILTYETMS